MKSLLKNFTERFRHLFARTGERVSLSPLLMSILNRREQQNDLPWLTPERAVELYEDYRAGNYAEIQLVWEQLEDYDETLFTVLAKRQRTLAAMPWQVSIDAAAVGDDPAKQQLAEAQQEFLNKALLAVENLEEALVHLGMADFRGVAALEITGNATRQRWEVIEPWNLARPARRGPWLYNEKADPCYTSLETLDATRCIIREERPIDLPVMFLIVDKMHAIKGWDTFLDVFGSPSIFLELPPATSEQKALEYDRRVQQIVSDGRGTIPSGSKFQTVETHADNSQSFEARAKWCREAIITIATGGLLTVEAQSGSGTLAGNAHADSFTELVSGTAAAISNVVNVQWARPLLQKAFPGQRIYAYFTMAAEPADDRAEQAQLIATLAGAGYKAAAEAVSEMAGFEVREVEQPPMMPGGMMTNRAPLPAPQEESPLTEDELAAFASLATPNIDRMEQRQREVEAALRAAADLPAADAPQAPSFQIQNPTSDIQNSEECRAADPEHCRVHGEAEDDDREPWEKRQEEREHLEELMAELDRQEEAARDAEASGDPAHYNEEAARDRWSALSREGDPQTREDIEKRLAELERADIADEIRKTEAGKTIQSTLDSMKERKQGEAPSQEHHRLNPVEAALAERIKEISGRDVSHYHHSISEERLHHSKVEHPYLTDEDFQLLPDITSTGAVRFEKKKKGDRLVYSKTYGDTTYEVVESIGNPKSNANLMFTTEYITKHPADDEKKQKRRRG